MSQPPAPPTDAQPASASRFAWLRKTTDRVPTKWFAGAATVVFLGATAAFGGLATAAEPPLPELAAGDTHTNDLVSLTVQRAVLLDELPEAGITVEPGERVLALQVDATNEWTRAVSAAPGLPIATSFTLEPLPDAKVRSSARYDDATGAPYLQPDVPATLVFTYAVDADQFADGDELRIVLNDLTLYTGSFVTAGQWWQDPTPAVVVTVPIEDRGDGS